MTFDTEKFIREIESRKAIWDITSEEYSDRDLKKRRWEEITNKMCSESLSENEKKEFGERPVSKKKKTSDDDNLVQVLRESIVMREERERQQESDSDRLFILSLLDDFKNIPRHRKLSTKMELIEVIKRAQMETHDSEFSPFRQRYVDYEPGTSAARSYRPQISFSGQYRQGQGYSTEYGPETTSSGQYRYGYSTHSNYRPEASTTEGRRGYSTAVPDRQDNTVYTEALSPTDTNATDMSQDEITLKRPFGLAWVSLWTLVSDPDQCRFLDADQRTLAASSEDIFKPTWFAYDTMESFLLPVYTCIERINTETTSKLYMQQGELTNGTMVLIKDSHAPHLMWLLGCIVRIIPGTDGIARIADIQTKKGVIRGAFNTICPLPISS
ncbi:hypothetical protein EVAR_85192_1 [Eumeta japonica]|uniref:MADF domain-containing protein n=1 Tax=Eumeta variegata TaxID=151549 RepID=A0A4C1VYC8_EUMVA|nr:hypothetical protein EVAR_85192_1 [Eumeta japonica]